MKFFERDIRQMENRTTVKKTVEIKQSPLESPYEKSSLYSRSTRNDETFNSIPR